MAFSPYKTIENVNEAVFSDGGDNKAFRELKIELSYLAAGRSICRVMHSAEDLLDGVNFTDGYYIAEDGTIIEASTFHYSDAIDVSEFAKVFVGFTKSSATNASLRVHLYSGTNIETDWVEQIGAVSLTRYVFSSDTFELPENAKYIRISVPKSGSNLVCSNDGYVKEISLGETPIYGGTLNVTTGDLVSTLDEHGDPLETPVESKVVPQVLKSFFSENHLWQGAGKIIKLVYEYYYIQLTEGEDKMKSGYVMIDCGGLDLTGGSTPQTLDGLYDRCLEAIGTGKLALAENCINGTGIPISPLPVAIYEATSTKVAMLVGTLLIEITNADSVTVTDLTDST